MATAGVEQQPGAGAEAAKRVLRARIRGRRQARPADDRAHQDEALAAVVLELPSVRWAQCIAAYASLPGEPGTELIRERLRLRGVEVLLPVVGDELRLDWARDDGALSPSAHAGGGPEPAGERLGETAIARADVVLVPALAVDSRARRLGQGGGCYDRALAHARPGAPVLALLHDDEVLDADVDPVPAAGHDRLVDGVLTPTRWMWFSATR